MGNMSYCRFENTYHDLKDCYEDMTQKEPDALSEPERKYREKLIKLCREIAENYDW